MFIRSNLFSKGHPLSAQPGLSVVLENHKQKVFKSIKAISDPSQMTDSFLGKLVKESLVEPLSLRFDQMDREIRTENSNGYPRTIARISVPFTGDNVLLEFCPNEAGLTFPIGEVSGKAIEFDLIVSNDPEDKQRIAQELQSNRNLLESYTANSTKQVNAFNASLPNEVTSLFKAKFDEISKQHSIFDEMGIKDKPKEQYPFSFFTEQPVAKRTKTPRTPQQVIQIIENLYVETLNQINNNQGDVNNAIQSN